MSMEFSYGFAAAPPGSNSPGHIVSVEYEVFGQVQGCFFTKYLKETCEERGVGGWVKNSRTGTILGKLQGPRNKVDEVIHWLGHTGSPGSKIEKLDLRNWEYLAKQEFRNFSVRF